MIVIIGIAKRIITSAILLITFIYITVLMCFSPALFTLDVIDNHIKLIGPNKVVAGLINQKFISLVNFDLGITYDKKQLGEVILPYVTKSIQLLIFGMLLGLILGLLKGIADSRKNTKDTTFKLMFSIIPLSLPDVLIIALLQYIAIWLGKHGIQILKVAGTGSVNHLILPVIALALPSACYIARITAVSIEDCYKSEYIKVAVGKGCSPTRILWNHVMRNVIGVILKGLANITAMIICNMVIVEYMFSYPGLTKLLIKMKSNLDTGSFISIIVIIGIVYFVLDGLFHIIRWLLDRTQTEETA